MQEGRSSRTAAYVALLRALGDRGVTSAEGFHDEAARALLPSPWAGALAWFGPRIATLPPLARERIIAHVDLLVSRSLAIDSELAIALGAGCQQVVILGAGFDSRAHRMTALEGARVYEVDHPATQSEKQRRAADLARTCPELTYVACDFERDLLAERLQSAGHRRGEPTIWIWEGVTLYLHEDALRATLATIAACSAARSTLIVEYHDAEAPKPYTIYSFVRKICSRSGPSRRSERERSVRSERTSSERDSGSRRTSASPNGARRLRAPRRDLVRAARASRSRGRDEPAGCNRRSLAAVTPARWAE